MSKILTKTRLSENVFQMTVEAPAIARERKAGQFIILQIDADWGERIPLTIADADAEKGTVTIIFQTVGASTMQLAKFEAGDDIPVFVGPLGKPTDVKKVGHVVCVGGGVGVAPMHPIAQAMKKAGNKVTIIIGARTKELVIMEEEMRRIADELIIVTDDGSYGRKGLVTEPLKELCEAGGVDGARLCWIGGLDEDDAVAGVLNGGVLADGPSGLSGGDFGGKVAKVPARMMRGLTDGGRGLGVRGDAATGENILQVAPGGDDAPGGVVLHAEADEEVRRHAYLVP